MFNITFKVEGGEDVKIFAVGGENVLELARNAGVPIDAPCSGNGTCGKCVVRTTCDSIESQCLACQTVVSCDTIVVVPKSVANYINDISTVILQQVNTSSTSYGLAIDVGTTTVSALLVDIATGDKLAKATTGNAQIRYGADVINRIIEQQKPEGIKRLQDAIVLDTLIPLINNLCNATGVNRENITRLTVAANTTMNHLLLGVDANPIRIEPYEPPFLEFVIYDPGSIGIHVSPEAEMFLAPNIGSYVGGDITAGVSVAAAPLGWQKMTLFIDLGTNGEIVLGNNEFMMACACSAGPAFEGGDISCGMRATDGAIEKFTIDKNTMTPELTVIGDCKPIGLCGSGLIDVVAELFRAGIINGKGKLNHKTENCSPRMDCPPRMDCHLSYDRIRHDEYGIGSYILAFADDSATGKDIALTEADIDNFIRAKGAIFSGIMSLLAPLGFSPADIDDVLIAGGIGSGINIQNAISIGMLPDLPLEKYSYIGNSSLDGAYAMLIAPEGDKIVKEIASNMTYIDLSTQPGYMDEFIAACFLPHTDETLFPTATE